MIAAPHATTSKNYAKPQKDMYFFSPPQNHNSIPRTIAGRGAQGDVLLGSGDLLGRHFEVFGDGLAFRHGAVEN